MKTLVHLSDIHFGRVNKAAVEMIIAAVWSVAPDVIVISGDLTQRARRRQFQDARSFLDRLPRPQIVIPGNHDIPYYSFIERIFTPLDNYRAYITDDLEPWYADAEIAVMGINTARARTFKNGRISLKQIAAIQQRFCPLDDRILKILVTHHPFDLPGVLSRSKLVGRARTAMETLARCKVDILLAGHYHISHTGGTAARYPLPGYSALVVQAGTAISTRGKGEANSFNVLRLDSSAVVVERITWNSRIGRFSLAQSESFRFTAAGWSRHSD